VWHLIRITLLEKEAIVSAGIKALHARIVRTSLEFVAGDELSLGHQIESPHNVQRQQMSPRD
jgi:hypothetical protein